MFMTVSTVSFFFICLFVRGTPNSASGLSLPFYLLLELFSSFRVDLSSLNMRAFAVFCCTLFCPVWLLSLGGLLFPEEELDLGQRGGDGL